MLDWSKRFLLLSAFLSVFPAWAQNTSVVRGQVHDSNSKPIVSAFVLVTSQDTSLMRAATTDDSGEFQITALPVGTYKLQITADGYRTFELSELRASIGQVHSLDVTLFGEKEQAPPPAQPNTPLVEVSNSQLGVVMDYLDVSKLPLKSRDTFDLLQLQPGVQGTLGADLFFGGDQPGVVSVNGARPRSNNNNVNGGHAGDQMVNFPSIEPSPDAISEFRVISHDYDAELGRNSGSVLNVITKSGGRDLHGTAYEYVRNNLFTSKGFFDITRPDFKQNDFGGTLGGSLKRDKTFFFVSYEGRRTIHGITSDPVTVPTPAERGGNFSAGPAFTGVLQDSTVATALNNRPGCPTAVGAQGGVPIAAGTTYASIFPGNKIPSQCFDPTAADLLNQFVPSANSANDIFQAAPDARMRLDQITLRLDRNLTSQQALSFYYYGDDGFDGEPFSQFLATGANLPGFGNSTRQRFQQFNLSHSWTISAKSINESRFVYYRNGQRQLLSPSRTNLVQDSCLTVPSNQCFSDPSDPSLGITPGLSSQFLGVPSISLAGGFGFGNNPSGAFSQIGNVYQFLDSFSKIVGKHTLAFGADLRNQRMNQIYFYDVSGQFSFVGGGPNDVGYQDLLPNYLLGLPDSYDQGSANSVDARTSQFHFFAQDAWKLRSNLTFNFGLRWEWNTPQIDAGSRIQGFRPGQATTVFPCVLSANDPLVSIIGSSDCSPSGPANSVFPLGMVFPGDPGITKGITHDYFKSFGPRLGIAWSPGWTTGVLRSLSGGPGKSSVRLGWGMFYDSDEELILGGNFTAQPPFGGSTSLSNTFFNTPFLGQDGTIHPNPFNGFLNPRPGTPVDFALFRPIFLYGNFPDILRSQYAVHYHGTIQRQLGHDTLLQIGYVGAQGHRLLATIDQDIGTPQTCLDLNQIPGLSCGPFGADSSYTIPAGAIPAGVTLHLPYGSVPTVTGPNPNPITLVGLRRYSSPFCEPTTDTDCPPDGVPVFGSIFAQEPLANSSYNSLQALVKRHFSHGLQFLASYTWSKSIDNASSFEEEVNPLNPSLSRSLSLFDAPHRFVFSEYWRLPDSKLSSWARRVINGWAISSIETLQSGFPIRITSSSDLELMNSFDYETAGEPNQIAPLRVLNPRTSGGYYFDPSSFVNAPLGQIGDAPRTVCCGPGIANVDFSIQKSFLVRERTALEFRTEFFNLFNHTQFFNPVGDIGAGSTFGQVQRARDPRIIQFALRLDF